MVGARDIVGTFVNAIGRIVGFRVMGVSVTIMGDVVGISVVIRIGSLVGGDTIGVEVVVFGVGVMMDTGLLLEIMTGGDAGALSFNDVDGELFTPPQFPVPQ